MYVHWCILTTFFPIQFIETSALYIAADSTDPVYVYACTQIHSLSVALLVQQALSWILYCNITNNNIQSHASTSIHNFY